jgi:Leucine-rich repeat (LRR) protein
LLIHVKEFETQSLSMSCDFEKDKGLAQCSNVTFIASSTPKIVLRSKIKVEDIREMELRNPFAYQRQNLKDLRDLEPFKVLKKLEVLDINGYTLDLIRLTDAMVNLRMLRLCSNGLKSFRTALKIPAKLQNLWICVNKISFDDERMFDKLRNLNYLGLRRNEIKSINGKIFEPLMMLRKLDLGENKLKIISVEFMQRIPSTVTNLTLDGNEISNIQIKNINAAAIKNLKNLKLDRNNLTRIANEMFPKNIVFDSLSFSQNKIEIIEKSFIERQNMMLTSEYSQNPCVTPGITETKQQMMENMKNCFKTSGINFF